MRKWILLIALLAIPAFAEDSYQFHLKRTDGRTGLLSNPWFAQLKMSQEQLDRAAKDDVIVFDHASGAHWVWLMQSWLVNVEQGINATGSGAPGKTADLGITPLENGRIRLHCYRAECRIRVDRSDVILKKGESKEFPVDTDFEIAFKR